MVSFTGKVNLRRRGVTPSVAHILLLRLAEFEGTVRAFAVTSLPSHQDCDRPESWQVREVDVSSNPLKTEGLAEVFLGLVGKKELCHFNASECGVDLHRIDDGLTMGQLAKAGADEFFGVRHRVEETGRKIEDAFIAMLKGVRPTSLWHVWSVYASKGTIADVPDFQTPKLSAIDVSNNNLEYFGARMIYRGLLLGAGSGLAESLTELRMAHANLRTEKACRCLKLVLTSLKSLRTLDLSYNSIRGSGAKEVAEGLRSCESLEDLNLSNNGFGDPVCYERDYLPSLLFHDLTRVGIAAGTSKGAWDVAFGREVGREESAGEGVVSVQDPTLGCELQQVYSRARRGGVACQGRSTDVVGVAAA
eukprot:1207645-Rhodomonas_salina.1